MNMIKSLVGKFTDFGTILASCVIGFVAGMVTVHTVDTILAFVLTSIGFQPLTGLVGAIVGLALGICYMVLYLVVALRVCDRVENFIKNCRTQKSHRVYVAA